MENCPHDIYFKFLFSYGENVKFFLQEFFPELASLLNLESLQSVPAEKYSTSRKKKSFIDVLYTCKIKLHHSQIYIVFEHKSENLKNTLIQFLQYLSALWEEQIQIEGRIHPIILILFYNGKRKWSLPTNTYEFFENLPEKLKAYLSYITYQAFDLSQIQEEEILSRLHKNELFMLGISLMWEYSVGMVKTRILQKLKHFHQLLRKSKFKEKVLTNIKIGIDYVSSVLIDKEELRKELEKEEDMKGLAEELIEEGLREGIQKGIKEGIQKGKEEGKIIDAQEMVISAIEAKLEYLPEGVEERIKKIQEHSYLKQLLKEIIKSNDVLGLLKERGLIKQ